MVEKRRFSRVIYQAPATIVQGQISVDSSIQDLSLHGLLLSAEASCEDLNLNQLADVQFSLIDSDIVIEMSVNLIHMDNNVIRASIDHIDIESISHLKRLIELNVGDDSLLHRDIEHLSDLGEHL
ncbi:PilZ domain-containing protein [Vibrio sp. ZSDE26]|uniref:Cyclic diguanosine monophosphate-binding protein n=1 Tax=Vibrio amylolyticus TaxID=2847292 RepID=A0A9X1XPP6_9VIBR|nr:PilZ domain-containing protein [Vibrio amylolyticus]MCK6264883.1 PilZ domain-containing protein [Vibrio amylolyticus]